MDAHWRKLVRYESKDLIFEGFKKKHNREPNASRIKNIAASFIQAREYFVNSERADISVKPLLIYYSVLAMSRGVILFCQATKGAEALKPSHGLNAGDWSRTLSLGISQLGNISISAYSGTFTELIEATNNKSYYKHDSSNIKYPVSYDPLPADATFRFEDLILGLADLQVEYSVWREASFPALQITAISVESDVVRITVALSKPGDIDILQSIIVPHYSAEVVSNAGNSAVLSMASSVNFLLSQSTNESFLGIGNFHLILPIAHKYAINEIGLYFCVSYILGMLVRYHPSTWIDLTRQIGGDRITQLILRLIELISLRFPELVLQHLESPHKFEHTA